MKINKILVPIDFSSTAINALSYAVDFARQVGAELEILHVYHIPVGGDASFFINEEMVENYNQLARNNLNDVVSGIPAIKDVKYTTNVHYGLPNDAILERLEKAQFDLLIIGAKRIDNLVNRLIGSTAYHLIYNAKCPVLTIPEKVKQLKWHNIAIAIDKIDVIGFKPWISFMHEEFGSEFDVVHVVKGLHDEPPKADSRALQKAFDGKAFRYYDVVGEDVERRLVDFTKNVAADVLVLFPRQQPFLSHLFSHSVTKALLRQIQKPILSFHAEQ